MINLDNVQYIRKISLKGDPDAKGTFFRMNNGKSIVITCPYENVYTQIKNKRGINTMNTEVIVLSYKTDPVREGLKTVERQRRNGEDIVDRLSRSEVEGEYYDPR
tara:strand:+ start:492 stop:806 length:315 start_codon:yes stop_codon:yes gene_type:complete